MATTPYSFMNIFDAEFGEGQETVPLKRIVIPIIQRDYAQGRMGIEAERVRGRFLDSLYYAVTKKPITLDFVYGDIDSEGNMTPLDGQQRLTTLFLLHWYAAKKENIEKDEYNFLKKFSYATRYSARNFCNDLIDFNPEFKKQTVSEEIKNQASFPLDWEKDPTISSMLVMLDAIEDKFRNVQNLWGKLKDKCISFYFLPIKEMGLTDELYIKMNSRGKPLTMFEHFKAELEKEIRKIDEELGERIVGKIDREWTDLFWKYRNSEESIIDNKFLRYFKFICDVICYKQNELPSRRSSDEFELLQQYFSVKSTNAVDNITTMEKFLDCWCNIPEYSSPTDFLESFMTKTHEDGKILAKDELDVFADCLHTYYDQTSRKRKFPLKRMVLLYAITIYLQNMDTVEESDFRRRIRIVNNLIQNSEDEISDRDKDNRMPAILKQAEEIICKGSIDDSISSNFNTHQLKEEKEKIEFLKLNPGMSETLFALEDHRLLNGQISIIGLNEDLNSLKKRFESLFQCDQDKVDCAMMATGNYWQIEGNKCRCQFGGSKDSPWINLFHKSSNTGFDKTRAVLLKLLRKKEVFTDDYLKEIANDYVKDCENKSLYPFNYYYIKYPEFRPGKYGKMYVGQDNKNPYMFSVMQTESHRSENSYIPFLKAALEPHSEYCLSKDYLGERLELEDKFIVCTNNSYEIIKDDDTKVDTINITQNENGIDTENRITKLKEYINTHFQ